MSQDSRRSIKALTIGSYFTLGIDLIQNLLLLPLFIDIFGTELFGYWLATGGIVGAFSLFDLGVASLAIQKITQKISQTDTFGAKQHAVTSVVIVSCMSTLIYLVGEYFTSSILEIIKVENVFKDTINLCFKIALGGISLQLVSNVLDGVLISIKKEIWAKTIQVCASICGLIVLVYYTYKTKSIVSLPLGIFARSVFSVTSNFFFLLFKIEYNSLSSLVPKKSLFIDYFVNMPYLFFSKLSSAAAGSIEVIAITKFMSPEITTYFTVMKKLASFVRSIIDRLGGVLYPQIPKFDLKSIRDRQSLTNLFRMVQAFAFIMFSVSVVVNMFFVSLWTSKEYYLGNDVSVLVTFSLLTGFLSNIWNYCLGALGRFKVSGTISFFDSALRAIVTYILLYYTNLVVMLTVQSLISFVFIYLNLYFWKSSIDLQRVYRDLIYFFSLFLVFSLLSVINCVHLNNWIIFILFSGLSTLLIGSLHVAIIRDSIPKLKFLWPIKR